MSIWDAVSNIGQTIANAANEAIDSAVKFVNNLPKSEVTGGGQVNIVSSYVNGDSMRELERILDVQYNLPDSGWAAATQDGGLHIHSEAGYETGSGFNGISVIYEIGKEGEIFFSRHCLGNVFDCQDAERVQQSQILNPNAVERARTFLSTLTS